MKTLLFCFWVFMSGLLTAQTIDSPAFKARNGSIRNITRIERTYDISLVPAKKKDQSLLKAVEGNWFADNAQGHWVYGIHDSIVIMDNRLYDLTECRKKGKRLILNALDRFVIPCHDAERALQLSL